MFLIIYKSVLYFPCVSRHIFGKHKNDLVECPICVVQDVFLSKRNSRRSEHPYSVCLTQPACCTPTNVKTSFARALGDRRHGRPLLSGHRTTNPKRRAVVSGYVFHADHREFLHAHVLGDEPTARANAAVQEGVRVRPVRRTDVLSGQHAVLCEC